MRVFPVKPTTMRQSNAREQRKTDNGILLTVRKYKPGPDPTRFPKKLFDRQGYPTKGYKDFFILLGYANVLNPATNEVQHFPQGTVFINEVIQEERKDTHVAIHVPLEASLTYEDWRVLRFTIDEMFLEQGKVPL